TFGIDPKLLATILTGLLVPIFITFLGYWLVRRSERKKGIYDEKSRVYSELKEKVAGMARGLNDYRNLQLIKISKGDLNDYRTMLIRLMRLRSILLNENCVNVLRDYMISYEDEEDQ